MDTVIFHHLYVFRICQSQLWESVSQKFHSGSFPRPQQQHHPTTENQPWKWHTHIMHSGFESLVPMLYEHRMQLCTSSNSKIQQCYASIRWAQPWNYSIHSNNNSRFAQNAIPMGLASLQSRDPWSLQHQTKA